MKRAFGRVRAYDADDIEAWLESAPGVHLAFSRLLDKRAPGTIDLESWWDDGELETDPTFTAALVLAGREKAVRDLEEWIRSGVTQPIALQAESSEEAVAVLAACVMLLPLDERDRHLGRAIVIRDRESWDRYSEMEGQFLLVPRFRVDAQGASSAARKGNSVYVPLDRVSISTGSAIQLPRLSWDGAKTSLLAMGKNESAARQLATLARRSLLGLRRKMARRPALQQPAWAAAEPARKSSFHLFSQGLGPSRRPQTRRRSLQLRGCRMRVSGTSPPSGPTPKTRQSGGLRRSGLSPRRRMHGPSWATSPFRRTSKGLQRSRLRCSAKPTPYTTFHPRSGSWLRYSVRHL